MSNMHAFFDTVQALFSIETTYFHILLKGVLAGAGSFIVWLIIKQILSSIEKRTQKLEFIRSTPQLFKIIRKALSYVLVIMTGTYLIRLFNIQFIEKAFHALCIILLALPAADFFIILLKHLEKHIVDKTETQIDNIIFDLLHKFAGVIIIAVAIVIAFDILGINITPFIAGAGVAGIAIGFAAKDTLSNLIAGILLIIDRPFEIGDRIEVWSAPSGSATWGDVVDIGLRATKIKTTDNIMIIIPNNEIMKRDIVNYTIMTSKIRVRINIGVSYDADMAKTKAVITRVAESAEWILKDPPPKVVVKNFGESSVNLQLRVWIDDARKRMDTISFVTDTVKEAFDKEGIEIPYPRREITIVEKKDVP